jgi:hypothetical protein
LPCGGRDVGRIVWDRDALILEELEAVHAANRVLVDPDVEALLEPFRHEVAVAIGVAAVNVRAGFENLNRALSGVSA